MQLRSTLMPPPLNTDKVQHLTGLAHQIINHLDTGQDPSPLLSEFSAATGRQIDIAEFDAAAGSIGMQALVEIALTPRPTRVDDVTDSELIEIITYVVSGHASVSEQDYWLEFLERNLCYPGIVELIFHRPDLATPAEILAEAKSYEPIILPERLEQTRTLPSRDSVEES